MARMFAEAFDETEVAVFTGGLRARIGEALRRPSLRPPGLHRCRTSIARHVMKAAAENLVLVTLELGGKSLGDPGRRSADDATAAARVMQGKTMNAGQIRLAPRLCAGRRRTRSAPS